MKDERGGGLYSTPKIQKKHNKALDKSHASFISIKPSMVHVNVNCVAPEKAHKFTPELILKYRQSGIVYSSGYTATIQPWKM